MAQRFKSRKFIYPSTQIPRRKHSIIGDWSSHLMGLYSGREERTFQSVLVSPGLCFWFSQCPMILLDI